MQFLAALFIGRPLNIGVVAVLFFAGYGALRFVAADRGRRNLRLLLVAGGFWAAYAAWEWLILIRTPAADIRVDLLIILPLLLVLSAWAVFRALR